MELENHPWFVASQFHPEFKSKPDRPHPLFREFVHHALLYAQKALPNGNTLEGNPHSSESDEDENSEEKVRAASEVV